MLMTIKPALYKLRMEPYFLLQNSAMLTLMTIIVGILVLALALVLVPAQALVQMKAMSMLPVRVVMPNLVSY